MPLTLNGYSNGNVTFYDPRVGNVSVNLPLTNYGSGLEEITEFKEILEELISLDIDNPDIIDSQTHLGYKLNWNFHYNEFITGSDLFNKFRLILDARQKGFAMTLTPRVDEPSRAFTVNLVNESLTLMIRAGGAKAYLHKGVLFTFRTKYLEQSLQWYLQPDPLTNFIVAIQEFNYNV